MRKRVQRSNAISKVIDSQSSQQRRTVVRLRKTTLTLVGGMSSLHSDDIPQIARSVGASAREASMLKAIYELEGFGGHEFDRHRTPAQLVAAELAELRLLSPQPSQPLAA